MEDNGRSSSSLPLNNGTPFKVSEECRDITDSVHLLPCSIKYNGPSDISHYFKPKSTGNVVDGLEVKEAFFRGRKLAGATLPLPENYHGFILQKMEVENHKGSKKTLPLQETEVSWNAISSFQNITYWNHDTLPSEADTINCCFHWFTVANAISKPVTAIEVASMINGNKTKNAMAGSSSLRQQDEWVEREIDLYSPPSCRPKNSNDWTWDYVKPNQRRPGLYDCRFCESLDLTPSSVANRMKFHLARKMGNDVRICQRVTKAVNMRALALVLKKQQDGDVRNKLQELIREAISQGEDNATFVGPRIKITQHELDQYRAIIAESYRDPSSMTVHGGGRGGVSSTSSTSSTQEAGLSHMAPSQVSSSRGREMARYRKEVHEQARSTIALKWCKNMLPFTMFKNGDLQAICDAAIEAGPGFKVPSHHQVRTKYLWGALEEVRRKMRWHYFVWEETGCSVLVDGWTDKRDRSLLNFLVTSAAGTMFFKAIDASGKMKDTAFLLDCFTETVHQIGVGCIVQFITNNAEEFVSAGKALMTEFPTIYWSPCAAHSLDLVLEDINKLDWVDKVVKKAKYLSKFIYGHNILHHLFLRYSGKKEIIRPGMTCFATNYLFLHSVLKHKVAIMQMFVSAEFTKDPAFAALRDSREGIHCKDCIAYDEHMFWEVVDDVVKISTPLVKVLSIVDGDTPPMGYIYEAMERAKRHISGIMSEQHRAIGYADISKLIENRWNNMLHIDLHALGHIFNPLYGFDQGDRIDADEVLSPSFIKVLKRIYPGRSKQDSIFRRRLVKEYAIYKRPAGSSPEIVAVDSMDARLVALEEHPEQWWAHYGSVDFPNLAKFARRILSQSMSASRCERNWSMFEHIHSKKRNRLAYDRLRAVVYFNLSRFFRPSNIEATIDLDEIDPSLLASQWMMDIPLETDGPQAPPDYSSDPEPELPTDDQHELISIAPLFGEMEPDDDDDGAGPNVPPISTDVVADEPPPPPEDDDDDDVYALIDSIPRRVDDRFTIDDLIPMEVDEFLLDDALAEVEGGDGEAVEELDGQYGHGQKRQRGDTNRVKGPGRSRKDRGRDGRSGGRRSGKSTGVHIG